MAAFQPRNYIPLKPDGSQQVAILGCMGCQDGIVVVEELIQSQTNAGAAVYRGFHWWPTPGSVGLAADIPTDVASAYSEGMRALGVKAPRAAAVMF